MGKKRKLARVSDDAQDTKGNQDSVVINDGNVETNSKPIKKTNKTKSSQLSKDTEVTKSISVTESPQLEDNSNINEKQIESKGIKKPKKLNDKESSSAHVNMVTKKATKIRFVNDAPQTVGAASIPQSTDVNKKKNKQNEQHNEEDDVKDEDIDKFCDELTEEDNEQFDNWVKLIEDKLHSKKNK